jgi:O-antigen/teichoic acid export membrane protein
MSSFTFGGMLRSGAGTVISQGVTLALLPLLFRLYSPEAFAPWATVLAIVALIGGVATLRYDLAIVVERDHANASSLFWLAMGLCIGISLVAGLSGFLPQIRHALFGNAADELLSTLSAVWLMLTALSLPLQGWILRRGAFAEISMAQVGNVAITNLIQISGGLLIHDPRWLIIGSTCGQATLVSVLVWLVLRGGSAPASYRACGDRLLPMAKLYRRFPVFSAPFTLCTVIRERAAILVLGNWTNATQVGLYSQAWRLMNVPVGISSSAVRPVVFHAAAEQGLAAQEARINRVLMGLAMAGAPWLAILAYQPETLFALVLGETWRHAGSFATLMAVPIFLFTLSNWMDRILDVMGRQDLNLLTEVVSALTSTAGLGIALAAGASIWTAIAMQCLILAINYALFMFIIFRTAGYRMIALVRLAITTILIAAVFAAILRVSGTYMPVEMVYSTVSLAALLFGGISLWSRLRGMR